jgi:hypothetical protein
MIASTQNVPSPPLMNYTKNQPHPSYIDFRKLVPPISTLESKLLDQPEFKIGLNWGVPRFGHPEGKVGFHIVEVLENIKQLKTDDTTYQQLRLVALTHDTFKFQEIETHAKGKRINHGLLARRYSEKFIDDESTLDLIELHDEIYYAWRQEALYSAPLEANARLNKLINRIGQNLQLHYLFFRCDTMTGDKIQAPRFWFEQKAKKIGGNSFEALFNQFNGLP